MTAASALGIVVSQFPRDDEAFILRDLTALDQGGRELVIFSLRPCRDRVIHEQAKPLRSRTVYAPFVWSWAVWRSHGYFLRRAPRAYLGSLWWMVSRHWAHPAILLRTLVLFPKTVHFARVAQVRGVRHLHALWATYPAASAIIMGRLTGATYSMAAHAHDIYTTNPTLREKMRRARFTVTCTESNKRYLQQLSMNGETVVVNYHGVDLARFAPLSKPRGPVCRIVSVGGLLPCKGFGTLIEACRLLTRRRIPVHCTIAGGGPLERSLRRQIARDGLASCVELTGSISQERVAALYQQAHLAVLPLVSKIHWGIPNVLIEALATRTPVISCALPSIIELVDHGRSGWIIPEQDPQALAAAIERLWNDEPTREAIAEAGYQRVVERFSLERTGERLRGLFSANRALHA